VLKKDLRVGAGFKPAPTKHKQPISTLPNNTTVAAETRIASVFQHPQTTPFDRVLKRQKERIAAPLWREVFS